MIEGWLSYMRQLFFRYLYLTPKSINGYPDEEKEKNKDFSEEHLETLSKMSNLQVAVPESTAVSTGNREVESEATEETTLTEVHKDLGHTKIVEKTAAFESNETTSVVEENKRQQSEASKSVVQSESVQVSANRQVTTSSFESSQSFSMEETEEYEIEG